MYFKRLQEDSCLGVLVMKRPALSLHGDSWQLRSSSTSPFLGLWRCRSTASLSLLFPRPLLSPLFLSILLLSHPPPLSLSFSLPKGFIYEQGQRQDPALKGTRTRTRLQQRWNVPPTATCAVHSPPPQGLCSAPRLHWLLGQKECDHLSLRQGTHHQDPSLSLSSSLLMARRWCMVGVLIGVTFLMPTKVI